MMKNAPRKDELSLRPIGAAFAAVVAGLGSAQAEAAAEARAPLEPASQANTYVLDPTNDPSFEEDPDFVVGPSEPVAPLAPRQKDLFK